jgi:hypothetical protein
MRFKLSGLFFAVLWFAVASWQPWAGLAKNQDGDLNAVTGLWWVAETLASDDSKDKPSEPAAKLQIDLAFDSASSRFFQRLAIPFGASRKAARIHTLDLVYLI